jgi:hypothetical protein
MNWKPAWWNVDFHKRSNLRKLSKELHLANEPWFIMKREHVCQILSFVNIKKDITHTICCGGIANESLFAIILYCYKQLDLHGSVIKSVTHLTDWSRMTTTTSPHIFKQCNKMDITFIDSELSNNNYAIFIRKISPEFPDKILKSYIYNLNKDENQRDMLK